jgi:hypothetical protein
MVNSKQALGWHLMGSARGVHHGVACLRKAVLRSAHYFNSARGAKTEKSSDSRPFRVRSQMPQPQITSELLMRLQKMVFPCWVDKCLLYVTKRTKRLSTGRIRAENPWLGQVHMIDNWLARSMPEHPGAKVRIACVKQINCERACPACRFGNKTLLNRSRLHCHRLNIATSDSALH